MTTLESAPDLHAADVLVERLFGAVLATMDLHAVYLGDRMGFYPALAAGPLTSAEPTSSTWDTSARSRGRRSASSSRSTTWSRPSGPAAG